MPTKEKVSITATSPGTTEAPVKRVRPPLKRPYQRMPVIRRKRNGVPSNAVLQRGTIFFYAYIIIRCF